MWWPTRPPAKGGVIRSIEPGKLSQSAYVERLSVNYRDQVLSAYLFESIERTQ
jgi:hypothetical protein